MNKRILLIAFIFTTYAFSQEVKINTKFTIEIKESSNSEVQFNIKSAEPYDEVLETSKTKSLFSSETKKNQIQGIFAKGKFGTNIGSMLILKSGYEGAISYELGIKYSKSKRFKKTTTSNILKDIPSIEYWPDKLMSINFIDFKKVKFSKKSDHSFDVKTDSTCLTNPKFDVEYGNKLLIDHIKFLYKKFSNDNEFSINKVKTYEKSIGTKDESPGNFDAFNPREGYVKKKKLAKPLSYEIIECPYFERETLYFFHKRKKNVRLVLFDWDKFEFRNFPPKTTYEKLEIENELRLKHKFIINNVTKVFGDPINEKPIEVSGRLETNWKSKSGIQAKTYLFIHKGIYNIRLYIFKKH